MGTKKLELARVNVQGEKLFFRPKPLNLRSAIRKDILAKAKVVLAEYHPMTVRQVYYRLVALGVVPNNESSIRRVRNVIRDARRALEIPFEYIVDRSRRPMIPFCHEDLQSGLNEFAENFQLDIWRDQPAYVEVWSEKDALSGMIWTAVGDFGVTVEICRGYTSFSALAEAVVRFARKTNEWEKPGIILYFGGLDPSGWDMPRDIRNRLGWFEFPGDVERVMLTPEDVELYNLPDSLGGVEVKKNDSRYKKYIKEFGEDAVAIELDSVPPDIFSQRLQQEVTSRMDMDALKATREKEQELRNEYKKSLTR